MDWAKVFAIIGLGLGVLGAFLLDRATVHLGPNLEGGVRIEMNDADAHWLPWFRWGWRFIIVGGLFGVAAVLVQ